jgi:hypothetical protein
MMATFIFMLLPRASVCSDRIQEVLDTPSTVTQPDAGARLAADTVCSSCAMSGFHYPGPRAPVLTGISFTCAPARRRPSSAAPARQDDPPQLDPADVRRDVGRSARRRRRRARDRHATALWSRIGLVPQKPYLFSGTIASNLRYGDPDATDEDLWQALEIAQARDFVRAMPGGLDARIDQGGTNVSAGSASGLRSRAPRAPARHLSLRRLVLRARSRDRRTAARALGPYTCGAAKVIVAQRVSTILHADQILVLEDGVEVGLGTHQELWRAVPTYRRDRCFADVRRERPHDRRPRATRRPTTASTMRDAPPSVGGARARWAVRMGAAGMPTEKSKNFGATVGAFWHSSVPSGSSLIGVVFLAIASVTLYVIGPRVLGHATNIIFSGMLSPSHQDRLPRASTERCCSRVCCTSPPPCFRGRNRGFSPVSCSARCTACAKTSSRS